MHSERFLLATRGLDMQGFLPAPENWFFWKPFGFSLTSREYHLGFAWLPKRIGSEKEERQYAHNACDRTDSDHTELPGE